MDDKQRLETAIASLKDTYYALQLVSAHGNAYDREVAKIVKRINKVLIYLDGQIDKPNS